MSRIRIPTVKGFLLYRTRDLISLDIPYIVSRTHEQHEADFRIRLQQYMEGKNTAQQKAAIKFLIEDCLKELSKSRRNSHKTELLELFHEILFEQLAVTRRS